MKWELLVVLGLFAVLVVSGCTSERGSIAVPSQDVSIPDITEEQKQDEILEIATHASVLVFTKNWDNDAEDDGIVVYPSLKDIDDETIEFEGVELDVEIEIWTTVFESFEKVKDKMVYIGTGKIDSWKDGNFMYKGGIKVPFEDIKTTPSDDDYGLILVKILMPDGKIYEANQEFGVRIK